MRSRHQERNTERTLNNNPSLYKSLHVFSLLLLIYTRLWSFKKATDRDQQQITIKRYCQQNKRQMFVSKGRGNGIFLIFQTLHSVRSTKKREGAGQQTAFSIVHAVFSQKAKSCCNKEVNEKTVCVSLFIMCLLLLLFQCIRGATSKNYCIKKFKQMFEQVRKNVCHRKRKKCKDMRCKNDIQNSTTLVDLQNKLFPFSFHVTRLSHLYIYFFLSFRALPCLGETNLRLVLSFEVLAAERLQREMSRFQELERYKSISIFVTFKSLKF